MSLTAGLALSAPLALVAATRIVNNCADNSTGSLRQVVSVAADQDAIDLHTSLPLACSTITLTSGEIPVAVGSLKFYGPSDRVLTITSAGSAGRILNHSGGGFLVISYLSLAGGSISSTAGDAKGGCIYSKGNVELGRSVVSGCTALQKTNPSTGHVAAGGAIYSAGFTSTFMSTISGNAARAYYANNTAQGGGVRAHGFYAQLSTVADNQVSDTRKTLGFVSYTEGGGVAVTGAGVQVDYSTISGNASSQNGGGLVLRSPAPTSAMIIRNSTVSGNSAGGMQSLAPVRIYNSTVAFNQSANQGAGILASADVTSESTIIARNVLLTPSGFADLYLAGSATLSGSHNLIVSSNLGLADTLTDDPQLAPLAGHGGPTRTHAILGTSPAVDKGDNVSNLLADQRHTGFAREVPAGNPDIGAYERQADDDELFYSGFD